MQVNFRNSQWTLNPLATDLHIYALVGSIRASGLTPDGWGFIAKQLCFIFPECDFATFDKSSGDGEIYLSISELIDCIGVLRDVVATEPSVDEAVDVVDDLIALQTQIAELSALKAGITEGAK